LKSRAAMLTGQMVGRPPWSARDALVPLPGQRYQHHAKRQQADGGVGRGPGGPPHQAPRVWCFDPVMPPQPRQTTKGDRLSHDATMSVMKLTFWGAAGTVTGSMHLLESDGKRYLLDCGLFQGRRKDTDLKNRNLPFPGASIDAVVLSHSHIDHSGNLPTLVKHGFAGPIYSTPASIDLCNWMLRDTAHIQEKDAEFLNKRAEKRQSSGHNGKHNGNGIVEPL